MKKIFATLLAVVIAAALLSGCQATPEEPIVIQKDLEQMIEKSQKGQGDLAAALAERIGAPGTYEAVADYLGGKLTLHSNAAVILPNADALPVVRVRPADFSQELMDGFYRELCGGAQMVEVQKNAVTKAYLDEQILAYQKSIASGEYLNEDVKASLEGLIRELEAQYGEAVDELERIPATAQIKTQYEYHPRTNKVIGEYEGVDISENPDIHVHNVKRLTLVNNRGGDENVFIEDEDKSGGVLVDAGSRGARLNFSDGGLTGGDAYYLDYGVLASGGELPAAAKALSGFTPEQALARAQQLLAACGAQGMVPDTVTLQVLFPADVVDALYSMDQTQKMDAAAMDEWVKAAAGEQATGIAYKITFVRTVNGVPVTSDAHSSYIGDAMFGRQWAYERLTLCVSEQGVLSLDWVSPHEILDVITENSALLPFGEISAVFEKMFGVVYADRHAGEFGEGYVTSVRYDVTSIVLSLRRVMEQDSVENGLFIPVWDFYAVQTVEYSAEAQRAYHAEARQTVTLEEPLLTINAIDGSVIDRDLGY